MIQKIFKILLAFVLLCSLTCGLLGATVGVILGTGLSVLISIAILDCLRRIIVAFAKFIKKTYQIFKNHSQLRKWLAFVIYTGLLLWPVLSDIADRVSVDSLCHHSYFTALGFVIFGYVGWRLVDNVLKMYHNYKLTYGNTRQFSIWGENNNNGSFLDFVWNSYDVNKKSLYWMRAYASCFCYPLFFISYVVCLTKKWEIMFSTVTLGSLCITIFALWYTVNHEMRKDYNIKQPMPNMDDLKPTKKEAAQKKNQEWTE